MARNLFIVIEGVDGTGKSTVAQLLAEMMNAEYIKTPISPMLEQRQFYDNYEDPLVRYLFYLNGNIIASQTIEKILHTKPVICDRYLVSTLCFHQAMGVDTSVIDINRLPLIDPDFYFYLQTDEEVRIQRVGNRGAISDTDGKTDLLRKVAELMPQYCSQIIDTTFIDAEEVAKIIYNIIVATP